MAVFGTLGPQPFGIPAGSREVSSATPTPTVAKETGELPFLRVLATSAEFTNISITGIPCWTGRGAPRGRAARLQTAPDVLGRASALITSL
jgi:hypothetical protein